MEEKVMCPFCGGVIDIVEQKAGVHKGMFMVFHRGCGLIHSAVYHSYDAAFKVINTRHTPEPAVETVEEYKKRIFEEINKNINKVPIAFSSVEYVERYGPVTYRDVVYPEVLNIIMNSHPKP